MAKTIFSSERARGFWRIVGDRRKPNAERFDLISTPVASADSELFTVRVEKNNPTTASAITNRELGVEVPGDSGLKFLRAEITLEHPRAPYGFFSR